MEKAHTDWREYVRAHEDLHERFAELLKEEETGEKIDV
jgi:hypothetical protein